MATETPEIRVTDSKARLTLPRSFANSTVLLEVRSENEIVIRKAKVVPLEESETTPMVIRLSDADWTKFLEVLDSPPEPTEELKALFTQNGPKGDNKPFTIED